MTISISMIYRLSFHQINDGKQPDESVRLSKSHHSRLSVGMRPQLASGIRSSCCDDFHSSISWVSQLSWTLAHWPLVLKADLDVPLRRRNDLIFRPALETRKLRHGFFDDIQRLLELFYRDNERWRETDNILMGWFGLVVMLASRG